LHVLIAHGKAAKSYVNFERFLRPQKVMSLTPLEEKSRCEATWQNFDEVLNGGMKCKGKFLSRDQVPVWLKSPVRQLDGKSEVKNKSEKVAPEATAMELPEQTEEPSSGKGGSLLSEWRKLRTEHPELFEQVSIFRGPEAYPLLCEQVSGLLCEQVA